MGVAPGAAQPSRRSRIILLIVAGVLGVWLAVALYDWLGTGKLTKADISRTWHPDFKAFRRDHAHDLGIKEADFQEIESRFADLVIDLGQDNARIELGNKTWTGPWSASPATGAAPSILVTWTGKSPLGRTASFTKVHGRIIVTLDAITLTLEP